MLGPELGFFVCPALVGFELGRRVGFLDGVCVGRVEGSDVVGSAEGRDVNGEFVGVALGKDVGESVIGFENTNARPRTFR